MRKVLERRGSVRAPEVLLVAGLLAVLLLAAAPTWRAQQVSRDVTLAKMRMQAIAPALLAYRVDFGVLPPYPTYAISPNTMVPTVLVSDLLTSPVTYLADASSLLDPFASPDFPAGHPFLKLGFFDYHNPITEGPFPLSGVSYHMVLPDDPDGWRLESRGPDLMMGPYMPVRSGGTTLLILYDPTNGVVSDGQIVHDHAAPYTMGPSWLMR